MLAGAIKGLAKESKHLTCLARTTASLNRLEEALDTENFEGVSVDYQNTEQFMEVVTAAWERQPFELVLLWVHSSGAKSLAALFSFLAEKTPTPQVFHVLGSAAANPANTTSEPVPGLDYHRIILGFKLEADRSRWLTHEEISTGTL